MAKKGKSKSTKQDDDVVYDDTEDEDDWVEDNKAAEKPASKAAEKPAEPERYDTPEALEKAAKAKEEEQAKQPPVDPNYDLAINEPVQPLKEEDK